MLRASEVPRAHRELALRAVDGLVSRATPVAILALAARTRPVEFADELGYGLAVVALVNLASSIGLPTVFLRSLVPEAANRDDPSAIARLYCGMTLVALGPLFLLLRASVEDLRLVAALCVLFLSLSINLLLDYTALGIGRFLELSTWTLAARAAGAIVALAMSLSGHYILAVAALGFLGLATLALGPVRDLLGRFRPWGPLPGAKAVGSGVLVSLTTVMVAGSSNPDIVFRALIDSPDTRVDLRLVFVCVNGVVALLPIDFFLARSGASAQRFHFPFLISVALMLTVGIVLFVVFQLAGQGLSVSNLLLGLALAAVRPVWRAGVAFLNGSGEFLSTAASLTVLSVCLGAVFFVSAGAANVAGLALSIVSVESIWTVVLYQRRLRDG